MGLLEVIDTFEVAMATQGKELLSSYNLFNKLMAYVKNKRGNLSTHAKALSYVISCVLLKLVAP
jgi:hypothetical protein